MKIEHISNEIDTKKYLHQIGVDSGGVSVLSAKMKLEFFHIKDLHVGAANILKQDALSIGADLAVPKGTILAEHPRVNAILIATRRQLQKLAKKELAQPFGLKELAKEIENFLHVKRFKSVKIMGIINANSDSFYSQSRFKADEATAKIESMISDGADIIDIGALSSRPNAQEISEDEEFERISPIIDSIYENKIFNYAKFSVDSYAPKVVEYALSLGFSIVNDIRGLEDDKICELVASYKAQAIIMHMQNRPHNMQENPQYDSILTDISNFFTKRIEKAKSFGVEDIVLDVGVGFGKSLEHNLMLIKHLEHFEKFSLPLLVGASRKSLINQISSSNVEDRLPGTIALHVEAIKNGASIIRVHDVKEHLQALNVLNALKTIGV
ncbi:MAG: dihydropteroate synthase [Campylobacterota bacterium]|nr:dihydropteroate synthase [Campylobacterota bacterium]